MRVWPLLTFLAGALLAASTGLAKVGPGDGGGGNDVGLEFATVARDAIDSVIKNRLAPTSHTDKLSALLTKIQVIALSSSLQVPVDLLTQNSVAINFPATQIIEVDTDRWNALSDVRVKLAIALHELEGLLGNEPTGVYKLSADLLKLQGFDGAIQKQIEASREQAPPSKQVDFVATLSYCLESDQVLDLKTGQLMPPDLSNLIYQSHVLTWNDDRKSFVLELDYKNALTDGIALRMLATKSVSQITQAEAPGETMVTGTKTAYLIDDKADKINAVSGKSILKYRAIGNNLYTITDYGAGALFERQYSAQTLTNGNEVTVLTQSTQKPNAATEMQLLSTSTSCVAKPYKVQSLSILIPEQMSQTLNQFIAQHRKVMLVKDALYKCVAKGIAANCSNLSSEYQAQAAKRDIIWSTVNF